MHCRSSNCCSTHRRNVSQNGDLNIIEIQGTAEEGSFSRSQLNRILDLAETGIKELLEAQRQALVE